MKVQVVESIAKRKGSNTTYIDTKLATLKNMLKDFLLYQKSTNFPPPQLVSCSQCQSTNHS